MVRIFVNNNWGELQQHDKLKTKSTNETEFVQRVGRLFYSVFVMGFIAIRIKTFANHNKTTNEK